MLNYEKGAEQAPFYLQIFCDKLLKELPAAFHITANTFDVIIISCQDSECYNAEFKEGDPMIHIAICDDEKSMADKIEKMAADFFRKKNAEITVMQYFSGEDLLKSK